jgi:hypothetical protein
MPGDRSAPARVPALDQFGQVEAVATADVGDDLMAAQPGQAEYRAGQVYRRFLVGVDRLPRGQVDVGLVLDVAQEGPVRPYARGVAGIGHPGLPR